MTENNSLLVSDSRRRTEVLKQYTITHESVKLDETVKNINTSGTLKS